MNILIISIYFFKLYVVLTFLAVIGAVFLYPLYYIAFGYKAGFPISTCKDAYKTSTCEFVDWTKYIFFIILIFFTIMYVIYIIIITIIPETGLFTLFIPIREMLLTIPPLQQLMDLGVFDAFDRFFDIFGLSYKEKFIDYYKNYLSGIKNDFYDLIKLFNPHLNIDKFSFVVENMQNYNKKSEKRNINNNIKVCVSSNSPITTPDMNFMQITKNDINNIKNKVKCNLKALPAYISTGE
jgi:hypothetical protein